MRHQVNDPLEKSNDALSLLRTTLQESQEIKRMNEESRSNLAKKDTKFTNRN
jgi:hypothetical protein